ncbi:MULTISPECIES: nuclear transport factor 2 family protein [Actinomycetes]|uniref:Nuclear transport factor 2 family protein n=3 Tax=Amycolatopsis TaxID=1813 RepID=A0A8E2B7R4_9PSEU|nr:MULTISPECIES: nuclear transport factor 2 family protein [Actinomycetes]AXB46074.1 hypothetical protein A4R43_29325 [Amycolatopsis albispora]MBB2505049.1 nuclear transport factor 2 family protein [Amycolatopsis echigonensis]MBF6188743.1 nuclear transport factor 2 family protein [Nocardia farcinica]MBF6295593.1 nuclear transport factor 2 family protein [Nocardia farcinica]MBF6313335.1 nuclear transport factor 2 family protein [Nocardia farcinica]
MISTTGDEVIDLEEQGWQALSSTPETARRFYEHILDHTAVMLLPGGLVLDNRTAILDSLSGPPWSAYQLRDPQVLHPTNDTAIVTYEATAHRDDAPTYTALTSSVYVRRTDGWKLTFHQQTPR